jgi:hypothetical protein
LIVEKLCIECDYQRKPGDTAPETECPHCGAIYDKVEAALRAPDSATLPSNKKMPRIPLVTVALMGVLSGCFGQPTPFETLEMRQFCSSKGIVPDVAPIGARGVRFTPNRCSSHWGDDLCRTATWPSITAPRLLARGFEFVEFDLDRRTRLSETFVRLHLEDRPNLNCKWIDDNWSSGTDAAIRGLEMDGIPRDKCIAANFGVPSASEYQFVLTTTEDKDTFRKYLLRAALVKVTDQSVIAEVWNAQVGGGDHFAGLGCGNTREFSKLLNVVVPMKSSNRP